MAHFTYWLLTNHTTHRLFSGRFRAAGTAGLRHRSRACGRPEWSWDYKQTAEGSRGRQNGQDNVCMSVCEGNKGREHTVFACEEMYKHRRRDSSAGVNRKACERVSEKLQPQAAGGKRLIYFIFFFWRIAGRFCSTRFGLFGLRPRCLFCFSCCWGGVTTP